MRRLVRCYLLNCLRSNAFILALYNSMLRGQENWRSDHNLLLREPDQRDRYLSEDELRRLKQALDEKTYRKGTKDFNKTLCRLRMIVLIAVTTGMRDSEIFGLNWSDAMYSEGLLAHVFDYR